MNKTNHAIRWLVIYPVDRVIQPLNNPGLLTVARQVLVFNEDNQSPVINAMLQSARELREKAENKVDKTKQLHS